MNDVKLLQNRAYWMFLYKLKKIKKYFIENLFKNFIIFNETFYSLSILFAMKVNKNLRFYVDYRKFNVMTKWNQYFLFLITEIIKRIIEYKYVIKFDIIAIFNKFYMHFNSDIYTIFITILSAYKYCVVSFDLINDLNSF